MFANRFETRDDETEMAARKTARLEEDIEFIQEQHASIDATYRERIRDLMLTVESERDANKRLIDQMAAISELSEDLHGRLRTSNESYAELLRRYKSLQNQRPPAAIGQPKPAVISVDDQQIRSKEAYEKMKSDLIEAEAKLERFKKEEEYYKKLYQDYKEKMEVQLVQKDGKLAQQEKLITHLQCQMGAKKSCCKSQDKKTVGGLDMNGLKKTLETERAKNVELADAVRRLEQRLTEKSVLGSVSEDTTFTLGTTVTSETPTAATPKEA